MGVSKEEIEEDSKKVMKNRLDSEEWHVVLNMVGSNISAQDELTAESPVDCWIARD